MQKYIVYVTKEIIETYLVEAESEIDARMMYDVTGVLESTILNSKDIEIEAEE